MNSVGVNLHCYCSNFVNLHIFKLTDVCDFRPISFKFILLRHFYQLPLIISINKCPRFYLIFSKILN